MLRIRVAWSLNAIHFGICSMSAHIMGERESKQNRHVLAEEKKRQACMCMRELDDGKEGSAF